MSKQQESLTKYNTILDVVSQIEVMLKFEWTPVVLTNKIEELKALVFYQLKMIERDIELGRKDDDE